MNRRSRLRPVLVIGAMYLIAAALVGYIIYEGKRTEGPYCDQRCEDLSNPPDGYY